MKKTSFRSISILAVIVFSLIVIGIAVFMTLKNTDDLTGILEESIMNSLISTSIAARSLLDIEAFDSYNSIEDVNRDRESYDRVLGRLRTLQTQLGAEYIYAIKHVDGKFVFIFDTDEEVDTLFREYELSTVHERAFLGGGPAGIGKVEDEYGRFDTGAVPVWRLGRIVGIICTDVLDVFIEQSRMAADRNSANLIVTLTFTMGLLIAIVALLMRSIRKMQDSLFKMANYDILTGLPNRQFMLTYLEELGHKTKRSGEPFAFMLIDLDNFKQVNDGAGHDAGDELLCHFGRYLESIHNESVSFRPHAGALNVSARIGGDEFVQIVPGIGSIYDAENAARTLLNNFMSQAVSRYVEKYQVGMSIGIALYPYHTENFNVLIKYADMAMYHAKKSGKNTFSVYNDEMSHGDVDVRDDIATERRQFRATH